MLLLGIQFSEPESSLNTYRSAHGPLNYPISRLEKSTIREVYGGDFSDTVRVREVPSSNLGAPTKSNQRPHGEPNLSIREVSGSKRGKIIVVPQGARFAGFQCTKKAFLIITTSGDYQNKRNCTWRCTDEQSHFFTSN